MKASAPTAVPPPSPIHGAAMVAARSVTAAASQQPPKRQMGTTCAEATTSESGAIMEEPRRPIRFGLLKTFVTVFTGLSIGAWISQKMAAFLEENELFVPEDDDDDDD